MKIAPIAALFVGALLLAGCDASTDTINPGSECLNLTGLAAEVAAESPEACRDVVQILESGEMSLEELNVELEEAGAELGNTNFNDILQSIEDGLNDLA